MTQRATATCDCGWTGGPYRSPKQAAYALRRHSCDKHRAQVAYAALRADQEAERERLIDRTPQPCHHKHADHQHGTYVTYTQDRCRCWPCTEASRAYNAGLRRRNAYGRSNLIDAEPVRQHVRTLMAAGIGLKQITKATGINGGVLCKLMYGTEATDYQPSRRIAKHNAATLLALDPADTTLLADGARTHGTGTRRRLQALAHQGWSISRLAHQLGTDRQRLDSCLRGKDINVVTARAVADLYDQLWDQVPPQGDQRQRIAYTRALKHARDRGWVGPLAWDDDTIDDPAAQPDTGTPETDRRRSTLLVDLEDLLDVGPWTWPGITTRLGVTRSAIEHACARAGRQDLLARLTTHNRGAAA